MYADDRRLDVLVLGPMTGNDAERASSAVLAQAIRLVLEGPEAKDFLEAGKVRSIDVHVPEALGYAEIVHGVLAHLDTADLVVVNVTPKDGPAGAMSPNVFYELGLVHALGIPVVLVAEQGTGLPFYFRSTQVLRAAPWNVDTLAAMLRGPIVRFLDPDGGSALHVNRVSEFYDGLPIVDISAAVGLATGYYHNFIARLIDEHGMAAQHPGTVKSVVIVQPTGVERTYEEDKDLLIARLREAGHELQPTKLEAPAGDRRGAMGVDHVHGIVVDLPRTFYPLRLSPRLLSLRKRMESARPTPERRRTNDQQLRRMADALIERFVSGIRFHMRYDGPRVRSHMVHFCSIGEAGALVSELRGAGPP